MIVRDRRPWPERLLAHLDHEPHSGAATVLAAPAALYELGARLKRVMAPDLPLPGSIPSLGIGNLRVGGSGKTPVVEDLGSRLVGEGERVAVLTRGYRSAGGGDEPGWLEGAGLTVFADPDRRRGFAKAESAGATRILLDDALQTRHRPRWTVAIVLDRDLERAPRVLPAGPAREAPGALDRADALFVRRERTVPIDLAGAGLGFRLAPTAIIGADGVAVPEAPAGAALLLSGLARPESFEADARSFGLDVVATWREADHWAPAAGVAAEIAGFAARCGADWVLVPEKNLQRARALDLPLPLVALRSRIEWDGGVDPLAWLRRRGIAL